MAIRAYEKRNNIFGIDKRRALYQTGVDDWLLMMPEAAPVTWNLPLFGLDRVKQVMQESPILLKEDGFYVPFVRIRIPHIEEPGQWLNFGAAPVGEVERSMVPGVQTLRSMEDWGFNKGAALKGLPIVGYYARIFERAPAGGPGWSWKWFIRQGQMPPDEYFEAMVDANRTPERARPKKIRNATATEPETKRLWNKERMIPGKRRSQYYAGQYEVQKAKFLFAIELSNNKWPFSLYVMPVKPMLTRMKRKDLPALLELEDAAAAAGRSRYFERGDIVKRIESGRNPRNWAEQMGGLWGALSEQALPEATPTPEWYNQPPTAPISTDGGSP